MALNDVINQLDSFDEEKTIYAKRPWHPDTIAIVAIEPDEGGIPDEAAKVGAEYFLEIFLANEFLEELLSYSEKFPSIEERCLRLIKYAENDA